MILLVRVNSNHKISDGAPEPGVIIDSVNGDTYKVIYMGLLDNTPGIYDWSDDGHVTTGEHGPYLNMIPEPCLTCPHKGYHFLC